MKKINTWKDNVSVLSVSDYRKIYADLSAEFELGELGSKIHNLLHPITDVYLNYDYENDHMLSQKNSEWKYSAECDAWSSNEFTKVKSVLAELREMEIPAYQSEMRIWESENNFLAYLKLVCVLRSRALLANSWRIEGR